MRTMTLPRSTVKTASSHDMPWAMRPDARRYVGTQTTMPTQRAAMAFQSQVRPRAVVGARSSL